eukprot:UN01257
MSKVKHEVLNNSEHFVRSGQNLHQGDWKVSLNNSRVSADFGRSREPCRRVFAHKYPPKYLGWEGSVLGDGDWK